MTPRFPLATVGALVTNPEGKVLIVRTGKWRGTWGVPGGKVEWGETLEAALLREFREEVGLELERVQFALLQEAVDDPQFHQSAHFVLINYFAHSRGSTITPNHEIEEWAWVTPEQAFSYPLNSFTRVLVQCFIDAELAGDLDAGGPGSGEA
jgi:ADP-ribose pyrophosphatase YjhB (NUDIX family)